jgi:hypothetical protein
MVRVFESCGFEYLVLRPIKYGEVDPVFWTTPIFAF